MEDGIPGGLQHRHKTCCEKGSRCGRRAYRVQRWHHRGDVVFRTGGLAYDIHTGINEQLVKDKKIPTKHIDFLFKVFNADGTKNGEVTKVVPLEIEINRYTEQLEVTVTNLDGTDMILGYDWLFKHNSEVNWKNGTIRFTRCPGYCTIKHEDIWFNTRR